MKTILVCAVFLFACQETERLPPPNNSVDNQGGSGGEVTEVGGDGGSGGAEECDPWNDADCCQKNENCAEGDLGVCVVDLYLCGGECIGKPNPVKNLSCGEGKLCGGSKPDDDPDNYTDADLINYTPTAINGDPSVCGGECVQIDIDNTDSRMCDDFWDVTVVCTAPIQLPQGYAACEPYAGEAPSHAWCCKN
jgi:hypothetical protein